MILKEKKFILLPLIISAFFTLPSFSEESNPDQTLLYNQLLNQLQNTSPEEFGKVTSDPDLATLMEVLKMVQGKNFKEAVPVLENLLKDPKGKSLTPQSRDMIKNLIQVMKFMESEYGDISPEEIR